MEFTDYCWSPNTSGHPYSWAQSRVKWSYYFDILSERIFVENYLTEDLPQESQSPESVCIYVLSQQQNDMQFILTIGRSVSETTKSRALAHRFMRPTQCQHISRTSMLHNNQTDQQMAEQSVFGEMHVSVSSVANDP